MGGVKLESAKAFECYNCKPRIKIPVLNLPGPRHIASRVGHDPAISNLVIEAVARMTMHLEHRILEKLRRQLAQKKHGKAASFYPISNVRFGRIAAVRISGTNNHFAASAASLGRALNVSSVAKKRHLKVMQSETA